MKRDVSCVKAAGLKTAGTAQGRGSNARNCSQQNCAFLIYSA